MDTISRLEEQVAKQTANILEQNDKIFGLEEQVTNMTGQMATVTGQMTNMAANIQLLLDKAGIPVVNQQGWVDPPEQVRACNALTQGAATRSVYLLLMCILFCSTDVYILIEELFYNRCYVQHVNFFRKPKFLI